MLYPESKFTNKFPLPIGKSLAMRYRVLPCRHPADLLLLRFPQMLPNIRIGGTGATFCHHLRLNKGILRVKRKECVHDRTYRLITNPNGRTSESESPFG